MQKFLREIKDKIKITFPKNIIFIMESKVSKENCQNGYIVLNLKIV